MSDTLVWVIGSSGLLGSQVRRALDGGIRGSRIWEAAPHFSWTDQVRLAQELDRAVATFAASVCDRGSSWVLVWCAGKGAVNSPAAALEPEWSAWTQLLELLGNHLSRPRSELPGHVFLASSAGGVYGGNAPQLLTERTRPHAISDYGKHKLRMEEALRNWAAGVSNVSCLVGRISTLYGPGQDVLKPQGIISHLSRCLIYRRPVSIYVPLDTRRDYLFVDDCASQIAASLRRLIEERPRTVVKILASEQLTSLAQILGVFFRIAKRRSLSVSRQALQRQSISLKFRSEVWRNLEGTRKTDIAAGVHLLHRHQLDLFQRGLLPPPG